MLNRFGGLGATVIRFIRRLGFDDIGIWKMGASTRWAFLLVASTWESLPAAWRRKIPFQIVRLHSVRLHHWRLSENGYKGLSGILSKSSEFLVQSERVRFFPRTRKRRTFLGLMAKPQGRPLPWQEESLRRAEIVVSAGHDSTFPHQWDTRYLQNTETDVHALVKSISRSSIRRWYAENLTSYEPVFSPLPGGVLPSPWRDSVRAVRTRPQVGYKGNRLFCAHRDKGGQRANPQFDARRAVTALASGPWSDFTTIPDDYLSISQFRQAVGSHPFTLCVEGGGIDPSPKAFEALLHGSIPVIRESPLADAYRHFPVLVVKDWKADVISAELLDAHLEEVRQLWPDWFDVTERLRLHYWAALIARGADTRAIGNPV